MISIFTYLGLILLPIDLSLYPPGLIYILIIIPYFIIRTYIYLLTLYTYVTLLFSYHD